METEDDRHYARIAKAIAWLAANWEERPDLACAADAAGLSPWHFQREFRLWTGVSPKRFLNLLALDEARARLKAGAPVLDAALGAGLSGPSRLHDLAIGFDGASPGEIRDGGAGLTLTFGFAESPFGRLFVTASPRGVTRLAFVEERRQRRRSRPSTRPGPRHASPATMPWHARSRTGCSPAASAGTVRLAPRGTNFQVRVWQALLAIPPGAVTTYAAIARAIGAPGAARAVGSACGANPVALLIPCHRVLRGSGALGGYAFGLERKRALIAWETARATGEVETEDERVQRVKPNPRA